MTPLILENWAGTASNYVLQIIDRVTQLPPTSGEYLPSDTLTATVSTGQNLAVLFSPTVSWNSATTGLVNLGIPTGQTTNYDTTGDYHLQVAATRSGVVSQVVDCLLRIFPVIGDSTQPTGALCTYQNVVDAWLAFSNLPASRQSSLIRTASRKVLSTCRRQFIQESLSELHDGRNNPALWLKQRPVITVMQVTVNGEAVDNTDGLAWTVTPGTGKLIRGNSLAQSSGMGDPRFARWWPVGTQNILVQYWAGFASIPDPIVEASIFMVRYLSDRSRVSGVYSAERIGDYNYSLNATASRLTVPDHVADLLADYIQDDGPI